MDTGLTNAQEELYQYMSDISEYAYRASWMEGTEYRLWAFMTDTGDDGDWGQQILTVDMRLELIRLSDKIDGWLHWVSAVERADSGPRFITTEDWQRVYETWAAHRATVRRRFPGRYVTYSEAFAALSRPLEDDEEGE